jgi:ubiquitin-like protein Pup
MSQRESAEQRRVERGEDVEEATATRSGSTAASELDADVDSILDEIDSVLEENAEDFVKSFVQKGGQ